MYVGDIEVTPREAIFSVTIASALVLVGFLVSGHIEHLVNQRTLEYRQAAQIADTNEFALAMSTDVGNAFVHGAFRALDPVSHENLGGKWAAIRASHEKYTMHTRVVHYTVTTGTGKHRRTHTRTRTEHYWTWDNYKTERLRCKDVEFCGSKFDFGKFAYSGGCYAGKIVPTGHHRRIVFTMMRPEFAATTYTQLRDGTVAGGSTLVADSTIQQLYDNATRSCAVTIFWWIWGVLIALAVVGFVVVENRWMEDK